MSDNIYKTAAQNEFRYPSRRGPLSVENLFQLPLKSRDGFDLDTVAKSINNELKGLADESFVEDKAANPRKTALETMLEIIKDVIKTQQDAIAAERAELQRLKDREKLLDIITNKRDAALAAMPIEELEKQLAEKG